jgi:hypothetical protein
MRGAFFFVTRIQLFFPDEHHTIADREQYVLCTRVAVYVRIEGDDGMIGFRLRVEYSPGPQCVIGDEQATGPQM